MPYFEYLLTDMEHFAPKIGIDPLPEIWGLSNEGEEQFEHKGKAGYPVSSIWMIENDGKVLALFDGAPDEGGVEIMEADVLAKLINEYGFPPETTIGNDGKPVVPAEE